MERKIKKKKLGAFGPDWEHQSGPKVFIVPGCLTPGRKGPSFVPLWRRQHLALFPGKAHILHGDIIVPDHDINTQVSET